jgi:hypothetical protein
VQMVPGEGFEPTTVALQRRCSGQLSYPGGSAESEVLQEKWLRGKDSNLRPRGYEPRELPTAPPPVKKKHI